MREVSRTPTARWLSLAALVFLSASCADSTTTPPNAPPIETPVAVSISPKQASLVPGENKQLLAQVTQDGRVVTDRTVSWRSTDAAVVTVTSSGLVTAIGAGSAKIVANVGQVADTAIFTVASTQNAPFSVVPGGVQAILGDTLNFSVVATSPFGEATLAANTVVWSSSDPSIATVSSDGVVATLSEGDVIVKAQVGNQTATASMKVNGTQVAAVTVAPANSSIYSGEVVQLTAAMSDDNRRVVQNRPAAWSSSDPTVATVSGTGLVTGLKKGVAIITVRADNKRASATVTVLGTPVATVTVALAKTSLGVGQTTTATALLKDAQGNPLTGNIVAWQSSNPALATVNNSGTVTAILAGAVTINAISEGKVGSTGLTITSSRAATVAINPASPTAMVGQTAQLSLDVRDATGASLSRPATWISATPAVATVSATGAVSAIAVGSSIITATVDGIAATATFVVTTVPVTSVSVSPTQVSLNPGGTAQLSVAAASATSSTGTSRPITWSSNNPGVATVDANGVVAAVAPGTARISATVEGISAVATVSVASPPPAAVASIAVALSPATLSPGQTSQAVATLRDAAGNTLTGRTVQWSSVDPTLATVSAAGVVTAIGSGSVTIMASAEGVSGASTLAIATPPPPAIAAVSVVVTPSTVAAGGQSQAVVTLTDAQGKVLTGRTIAWSSSVPSIATINASGTIAAVAAGTSAIRATSEGKTGSASVTVTAPVLPPTVSSVSVTVNPTTLNIGQTSQASAVARSATGTVITGRAISWVVTSGSAAASVNSSGVITATGAGNATVAAIVDGVTGTASLTVNTPVSAPPTGDVASRILGVTPSATEVRSLGGMFTQYEDNFVTYDEQQWATNGARWDLIDYYDRAMIYYAWNRRTGDSKYLTRANAVALDYRRNYLEAASFLIQPHWSMLDGVAMHYLTTGDEASRTAIGRIGDLFTGLSYRDNIGGRTTTDNRVQARYIVALLLANQIQAPSTGVPAGGIPGGHDWAAELRRALPLILSTQDADGAWRLSDCGDGGPRAVHPFTTGLLLDALSRYYDIFEADPRIITAVKKGADYLWANDWIPASAAFKYVERVCPSEGGPSAAPDLNNLIVNGYAWVYKQTGDATYKQRADAIFGGAVAGAWLSPTKQFNQVYSSSFRYLAFRK